MAKITRNTSAAPKKLASVSTKKATSVPVKYYLIAYNVLSAIGWAYILISITIHVLNLDKKSSAAPTTSSILSRLFSSIPFLKYGQKINSAGGLEARLHPIFVPYYRRTTTTFVRVGIATTWVQTCALLEVVHILLGWDLRPIQNTVLRVTSRLFLVWGVVNQFASVRSNPLYTSMVFAWSFTEVIRYSYYACTLLQYKPGILVYLRYSSFYVLYPLGAFSEAFLIYATLPTTAPFLIWHSRGSDMWKPSDYIRAALFLMWWLCLYVMYNYMIEQRSKILKSGMLSGQQQWHPQQQQQEELALYRPPHIRASQQPQPRPLTKPYQPHHKSPSPEPHSPRPDQNQTNQHDPHYTDLRKRANEERDAMARSFQESGEAYTRGDRLRSKELSDQGKNHRLKMEQLNKQASDLIFVENNKDCKPGEIDLHRLSVKEAIAHTDSAIEQAKRKGYSEIRLIVGKGLHSQGGIAKIKPAIMEDLMRKSIILL